MLASSRIDAALDAAVEEKRIVGGVVLVAQDGELAYHRAVGLADREANIPMSEETPFRLASFRKAVTSISWWSDREKRLSGILLTNTAFEGMGGRLDLDIVNSVWS